MKNTTLKSDNKIENLSSTIGFLKTQFIIKDLPQEKSNPQVASPVNFNISQQLSFKNFFNVYLFLRQRETEHEWGEGQRERETQNQKQVPGSELSAQSRRGARTCEP